MKIDHFYTFQTIQLYRISFRSPSREVLYMQKQRKKHSHIVGISKAQPSVPQSPFPHAPPPKIQPAFQTFKEYKQLKKYRHTNQLSQPCQPNLVTLFYTVSYTNLTYFTVRQIYACMGSLMYHQSVRQYSLYFCLGLLSIFLWCRLCKLSITSLSTLRKLLKLQIQTDFDLPAATGLQFSITASWDIYPRWAKYFVIKSSLRSKNLIKEDVQLQPCSFEKWSNFSNIDRDLTFKQNLCNKDPEKMTISGTNELRNQTYLKLEILRCIGNQPIKNRTCLGDKQFQNYLASQAKNSLNKVILYILDNSINAAKFWPFQQFINQGIQLFYDQKYGRKANVYLGTYIIETDTSIWPYSQTETLTGFYVAQKTQEILDRDMEKALKNNSLRSYGEINIYMSNKRKRYVRSIGKLDIVFSYVGGFFGLALVFFAFFLNSYSEQSYQLRVAESAFNYDEHGNKIKEKHFNFFRYIKFSFYDWVKALTGLRIPWTYDTKKQQTRQQASNIMDVMHIFRKIQVFELILSQVADRNQQILLNMTKPPTLAQVQNQRECMEYYNSVVRGKFAITIEDIKQNNKSMSQYRKIVDSMRSSASTALGLFWIRDSRKQAKSQSSRQPALQQINSLPTQSNQNILSNSINPNYASLSSNLMNNQNPFEGIKRTDSLNILETHNSMIQEQAISLPNTQTERIRKDIVNKFTLYSGIKDEGLIEKIAGQWEIAQQAENLALYKNMLKIEDEFSQIYEKLNWRVKQKILDKIPLKIVHRIVNNIAAKRKDQPQNRMIIQKRTENQRDENEDVGNDNGNGKITREDLMVLNQSIYERKSNDRISRDSKSESQNENDKEKELQKEKRDREVYNEKEQQRKSRDSEILNRNSSENRKIQEQQFNPKKNDDIVEQKKKQ